MTKSSSLILILLSFGIYYSFTSPQYAKLSTLREQATQYQDAIDNASRIAELRDNLTASAGAIPVGEKERLMKALPDNVDAVSLARELDSIASKYGIAVKTVAIDNKALASKDSISVAETDRPYDKATITLSFVASYSNFVKFLADLEFSLRLMDVRSISFQASDNGLYDHNLIIDTYWLK